MKIARKSHVSALVLSFFVLVQISNCYSQNFESILDDSSISWNIASGACDYITTDSIVIIGDTIIDENLYKILYKYNYFSNDTAGFIRENVETGQVWYREKTEDAQEYLIMNLMLEKDDVFNLHGWSSNVEIVVDTVYFDEYDRKIISFKQENIEICAFITSIKFIEGVGPTAGFFYQGVSNYGSIESALLCCSKNDELIFSNELFSYSCHVHETSINQEYLNLIVEVFPNPSSGIINIKFDNPDLSPVKFKLYSIIGHLIHAEIMSDDFLTVNIKTEGLYFYRLIKANEIIGQGKIQIKF